MSVIIIYNDGEICLQLFEDYTVGSISRKLNNKSTPEEFKCDLPVNQEFLNEVKQDPDSWNIVQEAIKEGLAMRKRA